MNADEIKRLFEEKEIEIEIDPCFGRFINYSVSSHRGTIKFKLLELLLAFGTIHQSRNKPTNRNKIIDHYKFVERVFDTPEFRIKIQEVRSFAHDDGVRETSYFFGSAITLVLAEKLLETKVHALKKITSSGKRADYEGVSLNNHLVILESKGSAFPSKRESQIKTARVQVGRKPGYLKAISATLLNENTISHVKLIDPPGEDIKMDQRIEYSRRAESFSRLFNFLGHKELSKYFHLMELKILNQKNTEIIISKEMIFERILDEYQSFEFKGRQYLGKHFRTNGVYSFIGIEKKLIYFKFFNEAMDTVESNEYYSEESMEICIYNGGILIAVSTIGKEISPDAKFEDEKSEITMDDIHYSSRAISNDLLLKSLENYSGFKHVKNGKHKNTFVLMKDDTKILVIIRRHFSRKSNLSAQPFISKEDQNDFQKIIFVIPGKILDLSHSNNKIVLDRPAVRELISGNLPKGIF